MNISIKKIEKGTGKKVKKNMVSIGFDWATRASISTIKTRNKVINITYNFIEFKVDNKKEKYKTMVQSLQDILKKQDI